MTDQHALAERSPQQVQCLIESVASVGLIAGRPQQGHERVPPMRVCGSSREIRQQGEPLGLGEDRAQLDDARARQIYPTECAELDHGGRTPSDGCLTCRLMEM